MGELGYLPSGQCLKPMPTGFLKFYQVPPNIENFAEAPALAQNLLSEIFTLRLSKLSQLGAWLI